MLINPSYAETEIFWQNQVNTIASDVLSSKIARSPAAVVLVDKDKQAFVFYSETCLERPPNGILLCLLELI